MSRRHTAILSELALAAVVLSGCAHPAQNTSNNIAPVSAPTNTLDAQKVPVGQSGVPRGGSIHPSAVKGGSPDAVASAAASTMYRYDTRLDKSPMDASRRAKPWLEASYAQAVTQPIPGDGGADWLTLVQHDGYTTTTVSAVHEEGQPADTAATAYRQRIVTITPHGRANWTAKASTVVLFVHLVRNSPSTPWQVSGVTTA